MVEVNEVLENAESVLKKLKNSCGETIKDRDRQSKEMFEIYKRKGKEADVCFAVGLSAQDIALMYYRMSKLIAISEINLVALRLTYNTLNLLEVKFPKQVKRAKSDLKKQIQEMIIGKEEPESQSIKNSLELFKKAKSDVVKNT
jgi:ribosomal protein S21